MHLLSQGAEAKVYEEGNTIIKERIPKSYRIKEMDEKIIKSRIKKESKILLKLSDLNIKAPKLIKTEGYSIFMEKIEGIPMKELLNGNETKELLNGKETKKEDKINPISFSVEETNGSIKSIEKDDKINPKSFSVMETNPVSSSIKDALLKAGVLISKIHNADIVHGDLTTLNFICNEDVWLIDFGLSFFSSKDEDKATDLYVFEKAIKCAHKIECINWFYDGYKENGSESVLKRLESVRKRGRKREENAFG